MTLFDRHPRANVRGHKVASRKAKAHTILDRVAAQHEVRERAVLWALVVTGDLPYARAFGAPA